MVDLGCGEGKLLKRLLNDKSFTRITGAINTLELGWQRNTTFDNASGHKETGRGPELEVTLPLFDWGQGRAARTGRGVDGAQCG